MKSLLAGLKNLPVLFKKHWWKIAIVSVLWKIVPIIIWWHYIEYWLVNTWLWFKNLNPWWYVLMFCVICAVLFLSLLRVETSIEQEEEHK